MVGFVVVSGLPASGKSTVARSLADQLSIPLLDKDDFLEALFPPAGVDDETLRRKLSRQADEEFRYAATRLSGALLTSWWRHPGSCRDSGTPTSWLGTLQAPLVEVHCRCSARAAVARFVARSRHPGHRDGVRSHAELVASFEEQEALGSLGLGYCIDVDTESEVQTRGVGLAVAQALVELSG
ncbi:MULTISPECIES: AAA family ATPase [unclassified Variovorax]|uniref:AAA family ATPase n=1 Tax=Variovorax sp. Sphag1AA TaxID=2587027 RepID=UPI001612D76E